MKKYQDIIIGFGKGGKTLATALKKAGREVALIEKSDQMYGGTCINVACIPSKFLENEARRSSMIGGSFEDKARRYKQVIQEKRELVGKLRDKNYKKLAEAAGVDVITGTAFFTDPNHIMVANQDGMTEELEGDNFYINTGARPFIPPIKGIHESNHVYISETLMEEERLPKNLVIIGGGYIGVEFASYYSNFGSQVTVIQNGKDFIPREDQEVAQAVRDLLKKKGVRIMESTEVESVRDMDDVALVSVSQNGRQEILRADAVLVATGRRPNIEGLNLDKAGVDLTDRGAIKTDEGLRTTASHIWAMGDVVGGLQFTYISLDDSRIVKSQVLGEGERTTQNRGEVPYSIFVDPPFSRVGLTEKQALEAGYTIKKSVLPAQAIPKALVIGRPEGLLKAIIDEETGKILGAHLFCAESQEMINIIKMVMDANLPYTVLRDGIFTHPTMSEALNDLFAL